ncbi:hypothetical protein BZG36_00505 [Bifiguratus adelaidae]|uniref:UspA domain-containing protein n=1 Tax=Bifiguratus adelaidae TaxID=1938954 RepID=A0A261Y7U6_9FUNG|nr:hypothetical protein BZG36_00505 [Bifiguratus adelaidae]
MDALEAQPSPLNVSPLLSPADGRSTPRTIMIAYDHSKASEHALRWALEHQIFHASDDIIVAYAIGEGSSITSMDATATMFAYDPLPLAAVANGAEWFLEDYSKRMEDLTTNASAVLDRVVSKLKSKEFHARKLLLSGETKEALVKATKQHHVDMLIIGSRGLGFLKRQLVGSTSDHCVNHCNCSVLVIRPKA